MCQRSTSFKQKWLFDVNFVPPLSLLPMWFPGCNSKACVIFCQIILKESTVFNKLFSSWLSVTEFWATVGYITDRLLNNLYLYQNHKFLSNKQKYGLLTLDLAEILSPVIKSSSCRCCCQALVWPNRRQIKNKQKLKQAAWAFDHTQILPNSSPFFGSKWVQSK